MSLFWPGRPPGSIAFSLGNGTQMRYKGFMSRREDVDIDEIEQEIIDEEDKRLNNQLEHQQSKGTPRGRYYARRAAQGTLAIIALKALRDTLM